jgi:hypothetical protein
LEGFIIDFGQNGNLSGAMYEHNVAVSNFCPVRKKAPPFRRVKNISEGGIKAPHELSNGVYIMYYSYDGNGEQLWCEFSGGIGTATERSKYASDINGQVAQ